MSPGRDLRLDRRDEAHRGIQVPYPILPVVGGLVIGLLPACRLWSWTPSWCCWCSCRRCCPRRRSPCRCGNCARTCQPISLLAFCLVLASIVAVTDHLTVPGMSWHVGFTLGAIVSPLDSVAAVVTGGFSVARVGLGFLPATGLFLATTAGRDHLGGLAAGQGLTLPVLIGRLEVVEPADRIAVEETRLDR